MDKPTTEDSDATSNAIPRQSGTYTLRSRGDGSVDLVDSQGKVVPQEKASALVDSLQASGESPYAADSMKWVGREEARQFPEGSTVLVRDRVHDAWIYILVDFFAGSLLNSHGLMEFGPKYCLLDRKVT